MALFFVCQIHWLIQIFKSYQNLSVVTALQPWVMVAKNIFPFATMTEGCKKVILWSFSKKLHYSENFQEMVSKMPYSWENPMKLASLQPSVMVAKGKISCATLTHGCKRYFSLCNHDWQLQRCKFHEIFLLYLWKYADFWKHVFAYKFGKKEPISFLILQSRFSESKI